MSEKARPCDNGLIDNGDVKGNFKQERLNSSRSIQSCFLEMAAQKTLAFKNLMGTSQPSHPPPGLGSPGA